MSEAAGEHVRKRAIEIDDLANFKLQAAGQISRTIQTPATSIEQKAESTRPSFGLLNFSS
ncbi:MAG: hypothetical protein WBO19_20820 [Terriglobia bacterium]